MAVLDPAQRGLLEKTVIAARDEAEKAAYAALQGLAVDRREFFPHMTREERALRVTLRAHGRQLGDPLEKARAGTGSPGNTMPRLVAESAYEHWHRMLFARFLAENDLL